MEINMIWNAYEGRMESVKVLFIKNITGTMVGIFVYISLPFLKLSLCKSKCLVVYTQPLPRSIWKSNVTFPLCKFLVPSGV